MINSKYYGSVINCKSDGGGISFFDIVRRWYINWVSSFVCDGIIVWIVGCCGCWSGCC